MVADGCIFSNANIERAVIGVRSIIESGATIGNSVVMGNDLYLDESPSKPGDRQLGSSVTL
jgi:ADP-glucose pyrophosphorylase